MRTALCKSCGQPVIFAQTQAGNTMPVNPAPDPMGTVELVEAQDPRLLPLAKVLKATDTRSGRTLHTSHFANCPKAEKWRKK